MRMLMHKISESQMAEKVGDEEDSFSFFLFSLSPSFFLIFSFFSSGCGASRLYFMFSFIFHDSFKQLFAIFYDFYHKTARFRSHNCDMPTSVSTYELLKLLKQFQWNTTKQTTKPKFFSVMKLVNDAHKTEEKVKIEKKKRINQRRNIP